MRIIDWSSDVCSSDLQCFDRRGNPRDFIMRRDEQADARWHGALRLLRERTQTEKEFDAEIGERCRERQGDKPGEKFQRCFLSLYPILRWRQVWRGRMSPIATISIGRFAMADAPFRDNAADWGWH